jgi:hypothetical protein
MDVTPWSRIPHGTMASKNPRSVPTFSAKPCEVIHPLETRTPMAAILSSPTHTPVRPAWRVAVMWKVGQRPDQDLLQVADVAVDVLAVGLQVQDRVAHQLAGAVVGHIAAPAALVQLHAHEPALRLIEEDMARVRPAAHGDDVGVLQEEELVGDLARAPACDQLFLERDRVRIRHGPSRRTSSVRTTVAAVPTVSLMGLPPLAC